MMDRGSKTESLRKAGIEESDIPEYIGEVEPFGIYPENKEAVGWFMSLQRRWIVDGMTGQYRRFDDQAMLAQMQLRGIRKKRRAALLDQLMIMESAALEELNKS